MVNDKLKASWNYLKRLFNHKKSVFIECCKEGLYLEGIIHDWSKFSPSEFLPYAYKFCWPKERSRGEQEQANQNFSFAWLHHQHYNKHHWNYWVVNQSTKEAVEMPEKYLIEMVCDWRAMRKSNGNSATNFYKENKDRIILHENSRKRLEEILF